MSPQISLLDTSNQRDSDSEAIETAVNQPTPFFCKLNQMLMENHLCDITLSVDSHKLGAHKIILSVRSKFFHDYIVKNASAGQMIIVPIIGFSLKTMQDLLKFMYTDQLPIKSNLTNQLLIAAAKFNVVDLFQFAEEVVITRITLKTAESLLVFANHYKALRLKENVMKFIKANITSFIESKTLTLRKLFHSYPDLALELFEQMHV